MESKQEELINFINENFIVGRGDTTIALRADQSLLDSGIIDSTGVMELVMFIEQQYSVKIDVDELIPENLDSVNNIIRLLKTKSIY
jgi:acyl carrier protein